MPFTFRAWNFHFHINVWLRTDTRQTSQKKPNRLSARLQTHLTSCGHYPADRPLPAPLRRLHCFCSPTPLLSSDMAVGP